MYQRKAQRSKLKRTQISLAEEDRLLAQEIARSKGVSMSNVIREAIRHYAAEHTSDDPWERLLDLAGFVESGDPRSSVDHDQVVYG